MPRLLSKKKAFFLLCLLHSACLFSQGSINAPNRDCQGNLTNFSYSPPSGLTLNTINWDFGDSYTSSATSPLHSYTGPGTYTVTVNAIFTNSTTATASKQVEIVGLPKTGFFYLPESDTCFTRNTVCYKDTSRPAISGQTITNRVFVWGDGNSDTNSNPVYGSKLCHNYSVKDKYTVSMEMTDKFGCKSIMTKTVDIIENIKPLFSFEKRFIDCGTFELCVRNNSFGAPVGSSHYKWLFDSLAPDTGFYFNNTKCVRYRKTKKVDITLIARANTVCADTLKRTYDVVVDSLPTVMDIDDTASCYSYDGLDMAEFRDVARDTVQWFIDNTPYLLVGENQFFFAPRFLPGYYQVHADIVRGSCTTRVSKTFHVLGPLAMFKVYDGLQCGGQRDVFMVDDSKGINRGSSEFKWDIIDTFGANCINRRLKDINKDMNCNQSEDWYTRHRFRKDARARYRINFRVKDTVNGCEDSTYQFVYMNNCMPADSADICQGDLFSGTLSLPAPVKFSLDTGKTWFKYPKIVDSAYLGLYDVGFIFETQMFEWAERYGDDSIAVYTTPKTYNDTIFKDKFLEVHKSKSDTLYVKLYGKCSPFRATVFFTRGNFDPGDILNINWANGSFYKDTFEQTAHVDSVMTIYDQPGINGDIQVYLENAIGCRTHFYLPVARGKFISWISPNPINCYYNDVCFKPSVYDINRKIFWAYNTAGNKISWRFDDSAGETSSYTACHKFKAGGTHYVTIIVRDSIGCTDSLSSRVFVQEPMANTKLDSRVIYCSELKRFTDSSSFLPNPPWLTFFPYYRDSITEYSWQFGSGAYSSLLRNPLQSLNTSLDKIPAAHAIRMASGCVDTFHFDIEVIGSKPYFNILDTIGCGSLTPTFVNLSRNCKQYIWQYGDSANTTFQTPGKQPVNFTYTKPGRYYISLVGIDTVYNPYTQKMQFCYNTFPDKIFQKDTTRSVLVLPHYRTGIEGTDTICLGSTASFTSKSDPGYDYDDWFPGDSSVYRDTSAPSAYSHKYTKAGLYNVKLRPGYNIQLYNTCRDSAQKSILVLDVHADFDIDPNVLPPLFRFHNKSTPLTASLLWDFGQPSSGINNTSSDQDPEHNYGNDSGHYNICLVAAIPFGCADTTCRNIFNDHMSEFLVPNVFTPQNKDGKNDRYDIQVDGEELYDLKIYDRWGVLVYSSDKDGDNSDQLNWDGTLMNKGGDCPSGTYYYIFRYSLRAKPGDINVVTGVITLIR